MSVILNKEKIQTGDVFCQKYNRTTVECDVIVPDVKPDILKILEVDGYISVSEKIIRQGKVFIQGTVNMTVLYAPDGDVISRVKSLNATQDFSQSIDAGGADGDSALAVEIEPESFNYTLINSRKVNLRCIAGISVKLTRTNELEIPTDISGENICVKRTPFRLCSTAVNSENRVVVCEQLELPSGKPTIGEILKTTVFPQSLDFSFIEDKAVVNGQVRICNLYISADDGSFQFTEHTVPFSETLEVNGAEEDMEGEIEYSVSDMYCELRDDSDGEARIIGIDLGLCAVIRGFKIKELEMLSDAYSLDGNCSIETEERNIEQLIDNTTAQITHKTSIAVPEFFPEIKQICDINTTASVDRIAVENGEITVFGSLKNNVLYVSNDEEVPLGSFSGVSEFTHTFSVPGSTGNTICDAKIFTEHVSYTLNGGGSIDLRAVLGLSLRSFKNELITPITNINIIEETDNKPKPYITIYFAQKGDSLWSIAKRYKTTVDALKECNGLTDDKLRIGQQIRICR